MWKVDWRKIIYWVGSPAYDTDRNGLWDVVIDVWNSFLSFRCALLWFGKLQGCLYVMVLRVNGGRRETRGKPLAFSYDHFHDNSVVLSSAWIELNLVWQRQFASRFEGNIQSKAFTPYLECVCI